MTELRCEQFLARTNLLLRMLPGGDPCSPLQRGRPVLCNLGANLGRSVHFSARHRSRFPL